MKKKVIAISLLILINAFPLPVNATSQPYLGEIEWSGTNFCPRGWLPADGSLLPISSNSALFSLLGTLYGGDGRTTFALPDLRGRSPIQQGSGPGLSNYSQGQKGGVERVTLISTELPNHGHTTTLTGTLIANKEAATSEQATNNLNANGQRTAVYGAVPDPANEVNMLSNKVVINGSTSSSGNSNSHENRQPFLTLYACIAVVGTFPSRN